MRNFTILIALALGTACQPAPKTEISTNGVESGGQPSRPAYPPRTRLRSVPSMPSGPGRPQRATPALSRLCTRRTPHSSPRASRSPKGEAMKKYNTDMIDAFSGPIELTTTAVEGRGDLAYAVGAYRATMTPKKAGAKPLPTEEGKYLEVLKKQADGSWKIVYDMWSANAPPGEAVTGLLEW